MTKTRQLGIAGVLIAVAGYAKGLIALLNSPGDAADAWEMGMSTVGYAPWAIGTFGVLLAIAALVSPKIDYSKIFYSKKIASNPREYEPAIDSPDNNYMDVASQERLAKLEAMAARMEAKELADFEIARFEERKQAAKGALEQSERLVIHPRISKHGMSKYGMNMEALRFLQFNLVHVGFNLEDIEKLKADVEAEYKADAQYLAMNEKDHDIWPTATDKRQYLIFCEQRRRMIELIKSVAGLG